MNEANSLTTAGDIFCHAQTQTTGTQEEMGSVLLCSLTSALLNWQIDDALNQCSSSTANPMEPISGLR